MATVHRLLLLALIVPLLLRPPLAAAGRDPFIEELMAGSNGDARVQFIVINQDTAGQNLWGPNGAAQSRGMLVFYDGAGRETGVFKFPANPPTGGSLRTLIATAEFAALPGAPVPDVVIPAMINAISGQVCFRSNPANTEFNRNECVSYGAFAGDPGTNTGDRDGAVAAGIPAAPTGLPITDTVSLRRAVDTGRNLDFSLTTTPSPTNIAGNTLSMVASSLTAQGEALFNHETFQGNGRTCATCHGEATLFRLTPVDVQARFGALATTFDPLFVGELTPSAFDAGFDGNLNVLTLAAAPESAAPCIGQLRGVLSTTNGGRATVLARVSATTYLVYGGVTPVLVGTVADVHACSATVASVTSGSLAAAATAAVLGLESPQRMRRSAAAAFPQGRALILENIDGFPPIAPVFRKSPHILNVSRTAPFGFSGDIPDLQTFSTGAVIQHFPRTLGRGSAGTAPDFRLPTVAELERLSAFMLALEFPRGTDPNKFDLDRFATTQQQRRGRALFFGGSKCSRCHGGPVLATTTASILGNATGINAAFNTGVVNQPINRGGADNLPAEAGGARQFSTPQLFNVGQLAPFFHDASAATLDDAVAFYNTAPFNNSPAGVAIGGIQITGQARADVVAFLDSLTTRPFALAGGPLRFGARNLAAGPTAAQSIIVTNVSAASLTFATPACAIRGANPGDFIVTSCPLVTPLAPGEQRVVQVVFDPGGNGTRTGILEFNATVPSGVDLFGTGGALGAAPTTVSISPAAGLTSGGTSITIQGTGFLAGASVSLGGTLAGTVTVVNSATITATTGARVAGTVDVVVTNPDAQTGTLPSGFNYLPTTATFADDPLVAAVSPVRARHFNEARAYIDALRVRYNLAAMVWSDAPFIAGVTSVKAAHLRELRAALEAIYLAAGRAAPVFSPAPTVGATTITAAQINEIRAAIVAIW